MAAETDVQFFSHLNAGCPQLTNNWGCMINLLDACLVNGVSLPNISSVTVATGGNITVNFASAHSVLLFQCVTLAGFTPSALNGKYRVIGVPTTTQLTLSSDLSAQSATTIGTAKLSPLGYQIAYSGTGKRAYRALNPTAQHPYIRVDESMSSLDGSTGIYSDAYAKYSIVGLIENMSHIDDYLDTNKLQLPLDTTDFSKNWKITGTGSSVVRGWSKWYWAQNSGGWNTSSDSTFPPIGPRNFTLFGDADAFYLLNQTDLTDYSKFLNGCGLFNSSLKTNIIPNWFLMSFKNNVPAYTAINRPSSNGGSPLMRYDSSDLTGYFSIPKFSELSKLSNSTDAKPILPSNISGANNLFPSSNIPAIEVPFYDVEGYLRGTLKHVCYSGKNAAPPTTQILLADSSMYVADNAAYINQKGGMFYFYLGELS